MTILRRPPDEAGKKLPRGSGSEPHKIRGRRKGKPLTAKKRDALQKGLAGFAISDADDLKNPKALFDHKPLEVWLEIGFGAGEHLIHQAKSHPKIGFIGCEVFENGLAAACDSLLTENLQNVRLYTKAAQDLLADLPDASLKRLYVLFPDPWPKTRHHKRRLIQTDVLGQMARALAPGGELRFASDHMGYVHWTLEKLLDHPNFDWQCEGPSDCFAPYRDHLTTRYEAKAKSGTKSSTRPAYLTFVRS